jgi:C4-dicarboxylate-specific signal transduction histidine kinase
VLGEKLASVGLLAAGVAHEINNPLEIVYNNIASLRTRARSRETREIPDVRAVVNASEVKLVVLNLIKNALEAMPGGGITTARAGEAAPDGVPSAVASLEEEGLGIPAASMIDVFLPFSTTKKSERASTGSACPSDTRSHSARAGSSMPRTFPEGVPAGKPTLPTSRPMT